MLQPSIGMKVWIDEQFKLWSELQQTIQEIGALVNFPPGTNQWNCLIMMDTALCDKIEAFLKQKQVSYRYSREIQSVYLIFLGKNSDLPINTNEKTQKNAEKENEQKKDKQVEVIAVSNATC
jgi:hypothetical protein